jgi:hypothetical protein
MCVILDAPKGVTIPTDMLELGHSNNPHGFGLFFPTKNGKVHVHKIMPKKFEDVLAVWNLYKDHDAPKSVHFRYKTKGEMERTNVHPFRVLSKAEHGREIWMMHNGTIGDAPDIKTDRSDTWHFAKYILQPVLAAHPELIQDKDFHALVEAMVKGDRMLFLDGESGETVRINPTNQGGHVNKEGIWISNNYGLKDYMNDWGGGYTYRKNNKEGTKKPELLTFIRSNVTTYDENKSLLVQEYTKGGKLEIMREVVSMLKDGNRSEVDVALRFSLKNTGMVPLANVGMRSNLSNIKGLKMSQIYVTDYKVRGHLTEMPSFSRSYLYANSKHNDLLPLNMSGVIDISFSAKFDGTKEEFEELSSIDLSHFYADVGFTTGTPSPSSPLPLTVKSADPDESPPQWVADTLDKLDEKPADDLTVEEERAMAEAMERDDDKPWEDEAADDITKADSNITYYDFNANPDWDMDFNILQQLSDSELYDTVRNRPEYIADFLKEWFNAL